MDLTTEMNMKADMIDAIKWFNETIEYQNNQYMEYLQNHVACLILNVKKNESVKKSYDTIYPNETKGKKCQLETWES